MKTEKHDIAIHTEFIKLEALLKYAGVADTGGDAKQIILDGEARVNGRVCLQRGKKLYPGDKAELEGLELTVISEK